MTRVLVVDDQEENLYYLTALLGANGWEVDSAHNGVEALAKARETLPDLVVSDLLMPVMDGFTLLRHWKSDASLGKAPFVVYTATYTEPEDEQLARKLGADDFILKPTEPEELVARLGAIRPSDLVAARTAGAAPPGEEEVLREYSEVLVRKLERKMLQLEETNRALQKDVAARERAEAALRLAEEQLRQAQKMEAIGQLAAGVAHDFNNLLSVILSYSSFIIDGLSPDDPLRNDVEEVRLAGERAVALTRQLLTFGRQQVLRPRAVDLAALVKQLEKMLRRVLREDISLSIRTAERVGAVFMDPGSVEQILLNLVVNARDAMPRGGDLIIEVADAVFGGGEEGAGQRPASMVDVPPGAYVMLSVRDSGHGMDAATRSRIFEPFFTTKPAGKGTGLGLATVYGIVTQSSGHVAVESAPGAGTTFRIYLPRHGDPIEAPASDAPDAAALRGSETILLVEDSEELRTIMGSVLRRAGYQVIEATTPAEALLASEQHRAPIQLLLTDVVMPRMNGRDLAERVLRARPETRVVYTSGYTEEAVVQHGVLDRGASFLPKPITREALLAKVREVLDAVRPRGTAGTPSGARSLLPAPAGSERILHVDDEESLVELTSRILGRLGFRVAGFTDPIAALRAFEAEPDAYHAAVTDVTMPAMSGFDLVRHLRRRRPTIAVVMTSAYFRPEDVREAESLGLRALLVKPGKIEELGLVLHDEIHRSRARSRAE